MFDEVLAAGGRVRAVRAPGMGSISRHHMDELVEMAKRWGAKGLAHVSVGDDGTLHSPIGKFLGEETLRSVADAAKAEHGDLVLIVADSFETSSDVLGRLRLEIGGRLGLADPHVLAYCWVHRFPMYKWDEEFTRWDATHNPFSGPVPEDAHLLTTVSGDLTQRTPDDPAGRAHAQQYDVALNGWELGGGSVRIHRREELERSFLLQGHSLEAMYEKFGGMLEAFDYGAPPHGGIALGVDRWTALFADQTNIREVMAFPKTQSGSDLMLGAPSAPDDAQWVELGLRVVATPRD